MKLWKKLIIITSVFVLMAIIGFNGYCATVIGELEVNNISLANIINTSTQTTYYDSNEDMIAQTTSSGNSVIKISNLKDYTKNAFIAIEDKTFYQHNGLNLKRMFKAFYNNLNSGYAKEGASTITQQLVKNSLLTNEKSIKRKIQEAYLATQVENQLDKDEILEAYLNIIYFGNGAYGIENAAQIFFNCSASELTIAQSATLAGIIKSPQYYSPIDNKENCLSRRNLVLKTMFEQNYITEQEYNNALNEKLDVNNNYIYKSNLLYLKYAQAEAQEILDISNKDLASGNYKIYTYFDTQMQDNLTEEYNYQNSKLSSNNSLKDALIIIDNKHNSVTNLLSNNKTILPKRLPGSLIKPLICYAPAFEEGKLSPATPILDEKTSFGNYNPTNVNNKYDGWISTRTALAQSKNIPAVKTLEYVGIDKAKSYVKKCGINFEPTDNHLALALGGMQYGVTPLEIANAYTAFANNGEFSKISFIKRIENKNGLVLYEHNKETSQVFSSETAYLINDVLQDTKTIGTAKKLSNYTNWAVKTGTAGSGNNTNTDAWCVAYSNNYTVCSWVGNTSGNPNNNLSQTQNGGNLGASFCKIALNQLPNQTEFITPENITKVALDNIELKSNNKLLLASDKLPKRYIVEEIFNKKYAPTTVADNYIQLPPPVLKGKLKENQISLTWENQPLVFYEIYGKNARFEKLIYTTEENISTYNYDNSEYNFDTFYIVAKYKNSDISSKSNELKFYLHKNNLSNNVQKIRKNWFY